MDKYNLNRSHKVKITAKNTHTHTHSRPDGEEGLKDLNNNVAVFKTQSKTVTLMSLMRLFP